MAKKLQKSKKKLGRPTKYSKRYCRQLINFFDIEPYTDVAIPHYEKTGKKVKGKRIVVWNDLKRMPNRLPTLRDFAKKIGVGISTVYDWLDGNHKSYHKEFSDAFTCAKDIRKWFIIQNGLQGLYPPASFTFVATNVTDMKNVQAREITGEDGKPIPVSIVDYSKLDLEKIKPE